MSNAVTDASIQRRILEILLEANRKDPTGFGVHRSVMKRELSIPEQGMDYHMAYLAQRRLVRLVEVPNFLWLWAKITSFGEETLENRGDQLLPLAQPAARGADEDAELTLVQRLADAFQRAHDLTKAKGGLAEEKEKEVLERLNLFEGELTRKEPDAGQIQKDWKWLKENADWVEPLLRPIVLEGVKLAFE
ncbi:MAG: hypothetical protein NWE76_07210 [Candidatus Bathyarchaeota archaeon]|jgi:hypothetical protein|nr:hypothetical protein [Candidatus Bathyarchaeota archaeon]